MLSRYWCECLQRGPVCSDGWRYLGSAIGTDEFVKSFVLNQVQTWRDELIFSTY